ncbi:MAG TPA: response regulator transcription factor [Thermoanaerobaculia bacterium]|nr:response regulator transcription factor [Thermoanaerobaculia bacterium]
MRILIADDHALFRDGLRSLLRTEGHDIVAEAKNGREAIQLAHQHKPDVVLMDLSMPEVDGLTATRTIVAELPEVKVIVLTASDEDNNLFEAIRNGAQGYLMKDLEADEFFDMLDRASRGEPALTPAFAKKLLQEFARPPQAAEQEPHHGDNDALTSREREVLELMVQGVTSNRKLAKQLGVSENTVKFHVRNILDKLRLHTRAEVVGYALRKRIIDGGQ